MSLSVVVRTGDSIKLTTEETTSETSETISKIVSLIVSEVSKVTELSITVPIDSIDSVEIEDAIIAVRISSVPIFSRLSRETKSQLKIRKILKNDHNNNLNGVLKIRLYTTHEQQSKKKPMLKYIRLLSDLSCFSINLTICLDLANKSLNFKKSSFNRRKSLVCWSSRSMFNSDCNTEVESNCREV